MNTAGYSFPRQAHSAAWTPVQTPAQTSAWTPDQTPAGMDWDPLEAVGGSDVAITLPDDPEDLSLPAPPDPSRLSTGEFFRLAYAHAFERTTPGFFLEETRIAEAEQEAGTDWDPLDTIGGNDVGIDLPRDREDLAHPHALSEAEFRAAGFDRGGRIAWTPATTRQRAEIEAATFDRRELEARLLELNADTLGRTMVGFGASFQACLTDPINYIPFVGTGTKGVTMSARILRGTGGALAGTALADAAQIPASVRRGERLGFADVARDLIVSGLLGGGIGAASGGLHNRRVAKLAGEQKKLAEGLKKYGRDAAEAERMAASVMAHIADTSDQKALTEAVRRNMLTLERLNAGKLLDRMMLALRKGEAPDVGKWAEQLGMEKQFATARQIRHEQTELMKAYDRLVENPFEGTEDTVLVTLKPEDVEDILVYRGPAVNQDGNVVVQGGTLTGEKEAGVKGEKKNRARGEEKKREGKKKGDRGYGLVKTIYLHGEKGNKKPENPPITRDDVRDLPYHIREWVSQKDDISMADGTEFRYHQWHIPREQDDNFVTVVTRGEIDSPARLTTFYIGDKKKTASERKVPSEFLPQSGGRGKVFPPLDFTVPDALPTLRQAIRDLRPRAGDAEPDQASPDQISPDLVPLDQDAPPRWKRFLDWVGNEAAMRAGRLK